MITDFSILAREQLYVCFLFKQGGTMTMTCPILIFFNYYICMLLKVGPNKQLYIVPSKNWKFVQSGRKRWNKFDLNKSLKFMVLSRRKPSSSLEVSQPLTFHSLSAAHRPEKWVVLYRFGFDLVKYISKWAWVRNTLDQNSFVIPINLKCFFYMDHGILV